MEARETPVIYLVALDGSEAANHVLDVACGLATRGGGARAGGGREEAAELHIVHVAGHAVPVAPMALPVFVSPVGLAEAGQRLLDAALARAAANGFQGKIVSHLATGEPWREITRTAARLGADVLVVGTAGRSGFARLALGSVAEKVLRHAGCTVVVVRPKQHALSERAIEAQTR